MITTFIAGYVYGSNMFLFGLCITYRNRQINFFSVFQGKDYDRLKMLEVGADEAERWERRKKKKNPDQGFSTYEDATIRCRKYFMV